ncbi:hypothetical protein BD779DRAFT_271795 [Infundibulicybe gibba]|nr:hypothetical protein BD779DRAFT_271795 [Infundibulicybe gibba]
MSMSPLQNDSASTAQVSLPSIQEMFPEYLTRLPAYITSQRSPDHRNILLNPTQHPSSPQDSEPFGQHPRAPPRRGQSPPPLPKVGSIEITLAPPEPQLRSPNHPRPHPTDTGSTAHSFNVLKSNPSNPSLEHISSSTTFPTRSNNPNNSTASIATGSVPVFQVPISNDYVTQPVRSQPSSNPRPMSTDTAPKHSSRDADMDSFSSVISFPPAGAAPPPTGREQYFSDDTGNASDDDNLTGGNSGKRHICPICMKRFNRPSSLRIHLNTHTGETPFGCPWPNCGRKFNVNSNMRRHHRNHTSPGMSRSQSSNDNRRRRRGAAPTAPEVMFIDDETILDPRQTRRRADSASSPPISSLSGSDDSEGEGSDAMEETCDDRTHEREEDDMYEYESRSRTRNSSSVERYMPRTPRDTPGYELASGNKYPLQSRSIDSSHSGRRPSTSTSPSPPPSPEQTYTPSAPYVRSFADTRVSTALRPAFGSPAVKEPPRSAIW